MAFQYFIRMKSQLILIYTAYSQGKLVRPLSRQQQTPSILLDLIEIQKQKLQAQSNSKNLKAFLRKAAGQRFFYAKVNKQLLDESISKGGAIQIEFFGQSLKDKITAQLGRLGNQIQDCERDLKVMVSQLKDQASQFYAMEIISKASSRSYSIDGQQHVIEVVLAISDPLASGEQPIFRDEIDVSAHIERLRRASMSDNNLLIKTRRCWANYQQIQSLLHPEVIQKKITIVQLFTHIRRINGRLMISLEGKNGLQVWMDAQLLLKNAKVDLLIVIGVGSYLLKQIQFEKPLILISSISIQQKRIVAHHRNILDHQNSYNDTYSQIFLEIFYANLFRRTQIGESMLIARNQTSKLAQKMIWCCCLHQHSQGCTWQQIISKLGYLQAHRLFKHSFEEWRTTNFYILTNKIQQFLLNGRKTCCLQSLCCLGREGSGTHRMISNFLYWNEKCEDVLYTRFGQHQKRLNKFQSEQYDKPSGRKRPITLQRLIAQLDYFKSPFDKTVLVIRSPVLSLAKRYLGFAKEYYLARNPLAHFSQLSVKDAKVSQIIKEGMLQMKSHARLGAHDSQNFSIFIEIVHDHQKSDKFYQKIFKDIQKEAKLVAKNIGIQILNIKIILLACHPNFDELYTVFKVDEPDITEKYQYTFSKYSYEYIKNNLSNVLGQIQRGSINWGRIEELCQEMLFQRYEEYLFIGFIGLFSDDGFYLTQAGRVVLEALFGQQLVNKAATHQLPIQVVSLGDSVYLQLHKSFQNHFKATTNNYKTEFQKKQLEYYFIVFQCYNAIWSQTYPMNSPPWFTHQAIFSIKIVKEDTNYQNLVQSCKLTILEQVGVSRFLDYNNFRHLYQLSQTERMIQNFMRKKKNQYVASSKSIIREPQPFVVTYLFWNVIHDAWRVLLTIANSYPERMKHLITVLLVFLVRVEATTSFTEIARLQLYLMIEKSPPKNEQTLICSKQMMRLLALLRTYSLQRVFLEGLQVGWGQTQKIKQAICSCLTLAGKISETLQLPNLQDELQESPMFKSCSVQEWNRQIFRLVLKKVLYFFQYSRLLRKSQGRAWSEGQRQFSRQFSLAELLKQFKQTRSKLPANEQPDNHTILVQHYLKLMNEGQVGQIPKQLQGRLSPDFLPLLNYIYQKLNQRTLFNQKGLIICGRTRTIINNNLPWLISRKRNLTMLFLKQVIDKMALKISYFTLNFNTLRLLSSQGNQKCEILFLILTIDSPDGETLDFSQDQGVAAEPMSFNRFVEQLKNCKISFLILCGQNSRNISDKLSKICETWAYPPNIIAFQSRIYTSCDREYNSYPIKNNGRAWNFLCNEVNQIGFDMLIVALVSKISQILTKKQYTFSTSELKQLSVKSLQSVKGSLQQYFQCTSQVLKNIQFLIWNSNRKVDRIFKGNYEDLTSKFHSSEHNLHDEPYYQNIGRCLEIKNAINAIAVDQLKMIEIVGLPNSGKSTLIQQICWISQTKGFFKFGVFRFNIRDKQLGLSTFQELVKQRQIILCPQDGKSRTPSVLIALDDVDEQFLITHRNTLNILKNGLATVLFSTNSKEVGERFKEIMDRKQCLSINMDKVNNQEVYALIISHLKAYFPLNFHNFSREIVEKYQAKVLAYMQIIQNLEDSQKMNKAIQLLKQIIPRKQQQKLSLFLNFYRRSFQSLIKILQNVKELKLRFV